MKIDFTAAITDLDDKPIQDGAVPLTLAAVSVNALLGTLLDDRGGQEQLTGVAKVTHATLAQAIHTTPTALDLKAEDVALLKDRIGKAYGPLTVLRAWGLLEGGANEPS